VCSEVVPEFMGPEGMIGVFFFNEGKLFYNLKLYLPTLTNKHDNNKKKIKKFSPKNKNFPSLLITFLFFLNFSFFLLLQG
jgi:hypothetical protein